MKISTPTDFDGLWRNATLYAIIAAWAQRGLFSSLMQKPRAIEDLPANQRALECTVPMLIHSGLLQTDGQLLALTPLATKIEQQADWPKAGLGQLSDLSRLGDTFDDGDPVKDEQGTPQKTDGGVNREVPEQARNFIDRLYHRSDESSLLTAQWLQRHWAAGGRILDLGGGHGRYAKELADRGFDLTLFDIELVVAFARERYGNTLSYINGDFLVDDLGGSWDGIFMSNIVHGLSEEENRHLLKRLRNALKPGAMLAVKDMFLDQSGAHPEVSAAFAVTMLMYTSAGKSYRLNDYQQWCQEAGFSDFQIIYTPSYEICLAR